MVSVLHFQIRTTLLLALLAATTGQVVKKIHCRMSCWETSVCFGPPYITCVVPVRTPSMHRRFAAARPTDLHGTIRTGTDQISA